MGKIIELELQNWINQLNTSNLNKYDITMINLITENLESISKVGTAAGKRAKLIGQLIDKKVEKTDDRIKQLDASKIFKSEKATKIISLQVESFRGFVRSRDFEFSKQYTFLYGPNGAGKSSLSEALEYGLLGTIEEADARNIKAEKYIKNSVTGEAKKPKIICNYPSKDKASITEDYESYRFSFIEKNRIDKFSHIEASTTKNQSERIAALFGMSDFNNFVREFTDSFDGRYLNIESKLQVEFDKSKTLYEKNIENKNAIQKKLEELADKIKSCISQLVNDDITQIDCAIEYLNDEKEGVLTKLLISKKDNEIQCIDVNVFNALLSKIQCVDKNIKSIRENREKLTNIAVEVNFSNLYEAINKLEVTDCCPACGTSLVETKLNPYDNAKKRLGELQHIEEHRCAIFSNAKEALENCKKIQEVLEKNVAILNILNFKVDILKTLEIKAFQELDKNVLDVEEYINKEYKANLEEKDWKILIDEHNTKAQIENAKYDETIASYKKILSDLQSYKTQEKTWSTELSNLLTIIKIFEEENLNKIKAINVERGKIEYNKKMIEAYEKLRMLLWDYNENLPIKLARDLADKTREYYNVINSDDAVFEKIKNLSLPSKIEEKIVITFEDDTNDDALQVLSEGHIKILGLAILLAKSKYDGMGFLIFDDIVNAIDDDHRDGVAELLINHIDFHDMQVILTCHGDQFITKLEDKLGTKRIGNDVNRYMFIPADCLEERGVVVEYTDPKYPLTVAREKYKSNDLKDSASKCRQAVECITNNLWKKISSHTSPIKVAMRAPKSIPDLASITDGLISHTEKLAGAEEINDLLHQLKEKYNWMLINKGTHFENEQKEFERADIKQLIEILERLDAAVRKVKISVTVLQ